MIVVSPASVTAGSHEESQHVSYTGHRIKAEADISQSASGNGCFAATAITINNPGKLADALEEYVLNHQPDSPFTNLGDSIVSGAQQNKVNPLFLVGIMQKESLFGTAWGSNSPDTYNAFGRRAADSQPSLNGWYSYNSWKQSVDGGPDFDDIPDYIRRVYIEEREAVSVKNFVHEYAPRGKNDADLYIEQLRQSIEEMIELAGNSISCGSGDNWVWPLEDGGTVVSCFGSRSAPKPVGPTNHVGIDVSDNTGSPVLAANSGEVVTARHSGSAGLLVEIRHNKNLTTRYLHNADVLVNVGETVSAGQRIAHMGGTGNVTRPLVHFQIIRDRQNINPFSEMSPPGNTVFKGNCNTDNTGGIL